MEASEENPGEELALGESEEVAVPRSFGALLRERRQQAGLTLHRLAALSGLSRGTLRNTEEGKTAPTPITVQRLTAVKALRLEPTELYGLPTGEGETQREPDTWFAPQYNPMQCFREMVSVINGPGGEIDQTYLYLDPKGAHDWYALCNGERFTAAFRDSLPLDKMAERILRETRGAGLDVDGLGCGDGKTETRLVQQLATQMRYPADVRLYLLDISHTLLSTAYRWASDTLSASGVGVFAVHGNFHDIARLPVMYYRPAGVRRVRIYSMLGYTLSNLLDELRFFRDLTECASPGDLVLIDFRLIYAPIDQPEEIQRLDPTLQGQTSLLYEEWLKGPILRHGQGVKRVTLQPTLSLLSRIPGSYEVEGRADVLMQDGTSKRFVLTRGKRYDPHKLGECLRTMGWQPVQTWRHGPEKLAGVMLLRRSG